jgi:hypothetical protein
MRVRYRLIGHQRCVHSEGTIVKQQAHKLALAFEVLMRGDVYCILTVSSSTHTLPLQLTLNATA